MLVISHYSDVWTFLFSSQVKAFGVQLAVDMCKAINKECGPRKEGENGVFGLHFYTLNSEVSTLDILKRLGMVEEGDWAAEEEEKISTPSTPLVTVFNTIAWFCLFIDWLYSNM